MENERPTCYVQVPFVRGRNTIQFIRDTAVQALFKLVQEGGYPDTEQDVEDNTVFGGVRQSSLGVNLWLYEARYTVRKEPTS